MDIERRIPESELIVKEDGSIYHLSLKPEDIADTIILVGDPGRVEIISAYFDKMELQQTNREIVTHTGMLNGKRLTVMSTGMGTDNIDIVVNELDALANIDLKTRKIKQKKQSLRLIRLGTSGAIQDDIELNSFIISKFGLGIDTLANCYDLQDDVIEKDFTDAFIENTEWPISLGKPYIVKSSNELFDLFMDNNFREGITATAPGFYGPQGRLLRLKPILPDLIEKLNSFRYRGHRITNLEMETSALYSLGKALGHEALTICVAIANRNIKEINSNYHEAIKRLVETVLMRLTQ